MKQPSTSRQFSRFLVVGTVGFIVDAAILEGLFRLGMSPFLARLFSVAVAMTVTWYLSRTMVFQTRGRHVPEYLRHLAAQSAGMLINIGVYFGLLLLRPELQQRPLVALVAASIAAMFFNFASAKYWTYRDDR